MKDLGSQPLVSSGHFSPGVGVLVCIPTLGRGLCMDWALALKSLNPPINYNQNLLTLSGMAVADARNRAAQIAIENGHKYLFFLGDDTIPPGDVLKQFIYWMERIPQLGVVGGVYVCKSEPAYPLVLRDWGTGSYWDWKVGEFFEVKGMGMDCTLIRVDMLKQMNYPFFETIDTDGFKDGINKAEGWTEDLWFCDKVEKEVPYYKKFIDASVLCQHYDHNTGKFYTLPGDSYPFMGVVETKEGEKKGIDIGCGHAHLQVEGYKMVTFDKQENTNPDYRGDVRRMPFDNKEFDLVYSSHVLEHLQKTETESTLAEWMRIVKDDGLFILKLPDLEWGLQHIKDPVEKANASNVLYGAQQDEYDFHYTGFTMESLEGLLVPHFNQVMVKKRDKYNLLAICSNSMEAIDFGSVEKLVLGE